MTRWDVEMAEMRRERELADAKRDRLRELERAPYGTPEHAIASLLRSGTDLYPVVNHYGSTVAGDYLESAVVSKDGKAVIVRMTPDQALRFADLMGQDRD